MASLHLKLQNSHGATALETAIVLPLVLLIMLILIWVGVMASARASLTTALATAVRLATTRGDNELVGTDLIPILQQYLAGSANDEDVAPFLTQNPPDPQNPLAWYHYRVVTMFSGATFRGVQVTNLRNLPGTYIYSLAYLAQALKLDLGPRKFRSSDVNLENPIPALSYIRQRTSADALYRHS